MKNWFIYYFAFSTLVSLVLMYMGYATTLTYIKVGSEILALLMYAISRSHDKEIAMKIIEELQSELLDNMHNTNEKILMMVKDNNEEKDEEKGN